MRKLEDILGYAALIFYSLFGVLAVFALGVLLVKGTPDRTPVTLAADAGTVDAAAAPADAAAGAATDAPAATAAAEPAAEAAPEPVKTAEAAPAAADAPAAAPAAEPAAETAAETAAAPAPAPADDATKVAAAAPAGADAAAGEAVFKKCAACHGIDKGGKDKTGPNLWGVVGGPVAHSAAFKYSDAMKTHGGTWTPQLLDEYLAKPKEAIPGNKMSFAGLPKPEDRANLIAWMATQSDNPPAAPDTLATAVQAGAPQAVATDVAPDGTAKAVADPETTTAADAAAAPADTAADAAAAPAAEDIAQIPHVDPAPPSEAQLTEIAQKIAALEKEAPTLDYERARHHPIHYPPMIDKATDGECLVCHSEVLDHKVRDASPAGVKANEALAWYQTLDTYVPQDVTGQSEFHWRHMSSPYAQTVMNLSCNFCHRGNDVREESPDMMPLRAAFSSDPKAPEFTNRKMVNPSETCLLCHGQMPDPVNIMGLAGHWPEVRGDMEDQASDDPATANGCLSCHGELFRTNRHNVTYLKGASIEELAQAGSDTCFGCHGGRSWYRISYPYARQPWPGMDPEVPEWAKDRPTSVDPRWAMPAAAPAN